MPKYKVLFHTTLSHVIDVVAQSEEEAKQKAETKYHELEDNGLLHYHESDSPETTVHNVFDVPNTEDPFNP